MRKILKQLLLVSIGVNISLLLIATAVKSSELALLSICSAVLCTICYLNEEGGDDK